MQPSLIIGRIAGIHIGLHYSWILIAVLLAGSFVGYFYESNPNWQPRVIWSAAIVITLLFFGSIVLHELAHALVAKAVGIPVRTITLFALGGVALSSGGTPEPLPVLLGEGPFCPSSFHFSRCSKCSLAASNLF